MTTILEQFDAPPLNHETTKATHFIHFPWREHWDEDRWQAVPELSRRDQGDIVTSRCAEVFNTLPNLENSRVIATLSHKSLVVVLKERVGPAGHFHYVRVVATNPSVNGLEGYVRYGFLTKLPGIAPSLPVTFKCIKLHDKNRDFCSITTPQWYTTTEPYLDEYECSYKINITTGYRNTGGDSELKKRMQEQVPIGIAELLDYYAKDYNEDTIARLVGAFKFAEASSWHLNLQDPNSILKVLVSVPARYFDALPKANSRLSSVGVGIEKHATLESTTLEKNIDMLAKQMRTWGESRLWGKVSSTYHGPAPFYKEYSFAREARRLEAFVSGLRRLLVLNGKAIRSKSSDTIEIGMTREYQLAYVLLTDDDGSHRMDIGLKKLKSLDPFNNPRTLAYIFFLFEISNEFKRTNSIKGGWATFLKKYTFPPPDHRPASKSDNCVPSFKDPFKCMPPAFKDFQDQHLKDIKCEDLPPEMRTTPLNLGASEIDQFYEAITTGEWSGYKDRYAKVKTQATNIISKKEISEFKKQIAEDNAKYQGSLDFVGDPFVEDLHNRLGKYSLEGFGTQVFNKFMTDVVVKIDIKDIISNLHQCFCDQQQDLIDELKFELKDDKHPSVKLAETAHAAAGCANPCEVLPILCDCLPIPWPLQFDLPDDFSITDILGYLTAAIIDAIITAAMKFLLDLIKGFISASLDCDRDSRSSNHFIDQFQAQYPFDEDDVFSDQEISDVLSKNNMPKELINTEQVNSLIRDTVLLLSPREFCELISGVPETATLEAVSFLINERYPDFRDTFSNHEKVSSLYQSIGGLVDPSICRNLDELISNFPVEPGGYICDETSLRDDISSGRATGQQIKDALIEASKCNSDRLATISDMVHDLVAGNDIMSSIMPELLKTPANPNGIIPRDPPPVKYMTDVANNSIFGGIEKQFYSEMNSNVPTLITTDVAENEAPSRALQAFQGMPGFNLNQPGDNKLKQGLKRTIADGLGEVLRTQAIKLSDVESGGALVKLDMPERDIFPDGINVGNWSPGDNLYRAFTIPGISNNLIDETEPIRTEKIRVEYDICRETPISINWNRVRDAFTVRVQDVYPSSGPIDLITFDGKKKIKDNVVDLYEDFRVSGRFSPSRELFSNIVSNKWAELPWPREIKQLLSDPNNSMNSFHAASGFRSVTQDIMSRLSKTFSKSKLLDAGRVDFLGLGDNTMGSGLDFDDAFANLKAIRFRPDISCEPKEPGLLNMDDILSKVSEVYENDLTQDSSLRYVTSVQYGVIMAFTRVFCLHIILNGMFPFSQFKAENILKSDLLVSYFMNSFRAELQKMLFRSHASFYEKMKSLIGVDIAQRKYVNQEDFVDPFTGEEVDVRLDPSYVRELVESTQHDPTGLIETIDLEELEEQASGFVSENLESVLECYVAGVDELQSTGLSECVPQTSADANNETSDGTPANSGAENVLDDPEVAQPDPAGGKRSIGYMEFFFKEQLKSISGEIEVLFGSEIYDIDETMVNGLSAVTGVPALYHPTGPRIFKNLSQTVSNISEQEAQDAGLADIVEIYDTYNEAIQEDDGISGTGLLERLQSLRGVISESVLSRYARELGAGKDVIQLIAEDLQSVVEAKVADTEQTDLINPKFKYLETGGFITEKYIRIEDLDEETWQQIILSDPVGQEAYNEIKNRPDYLKGVVNLNDWDYFIRDLTRVPGLAASLIDTRDDVNYINIKKYFKNWIYGKRMCYVYPISASLTDQRVHGPRLQHMLKEVLATSINTDIEELIKNKKTYFIKEDVELAFRIQTDENSEPVEGNLSLLEGQTLRSQRTYEAFAVPVVESEIPLNNDVEILPLTSRGVASTYSNLYDYNLTKQIFEQDAYKALFEYVFPLDRFVSLLTIYTVEYVSSLPGREQLFDRTKSMLYDMFQNLEQSLERDWWDKKQPSSTKWWEEPLDLSVPGILFMTPWKILQALLTLVPPLDWFLGFLLRQIPDLPPYKPNREDPCPEDRN